MYSNKKQSLEWVKHTNQSFTESMAGYIEPIERPENILKRPYIEHVGLTSFIADMKGTNIKPIHLYHAYCAAYSIKTKVNHSCVDFETLVAFLETANKTINWRKHLVNDRIFFNGLTNNGKKLLVRAQSKMIHSILDNVMSNHSFNVFNDMIQSFRTGNKREIDPKEYYKFNETKYLMGKDEKTVKEELAGQPSWESISTLKKYKFFNTKKLSDIFNNDPEYNDLIDFQKGDVALELPNAHTFERAKLKADLISMRSRRIRQSLKSLSNCDHNVPMEMIIDKTITSEDVVNNHHLKDVSVSRLNEFAQKTVVGDMLTQDRIADISRSIDFKRNLRAPEFLNSYQSFVYGCLRSVAESPIHTSSKRIFNGKGIDTFDIPASLDGTDSLPGCSIQEISVRSGFKPSTIRKYFSKFEILHTSQAFGSLPFTLDPIDEFKNSFHVTLNRVTEVETTVTTLHEAIQISNNLFDSTNKYKATKSKQTRLAPRDGKYVIYNQQSNYYITTSLKNLRTFTFVLPHKQSSFYSNTHIAEIKSLNDYDQIVSESFTSNGDSLEPTIGLFIGKQKHNDLTSLSKYHSRIHKNIYASTILEHSTKNQRPSISTPLLRNLSHSSIRGFLNIFASDTRVTTDYHSNTGVPYFKNLLTKYGNFIFTNKLTETESESESTLGQDSRLHLTINSIIDSAITTTGFEDTSFYKPNEKFYKLKLLKDSASEFICD